jgi:hypothetical protein
MLNLSQIERFLWLLSLAATAVLLAKLWKQELLSRYKVFGFYLGFCLISAAVLAPLPKETSRYAHTYMALESVFWVLYVLVTLELFTLIFRRYRGISTLGGNFIRSALIIALALSLFSLVIEAVKPLDRETLDTFFLISRVVFLSVLVFLCTMLVLLLWFPIPLSRNAISYVIGYTVYFSAKTAGLLSVNLRGYGFAEYASTAIGAVNLVCFVYWLWALNKAGESTGVTVGHSWAPAEERRLVRQLEAVNSSLMRTSRK